MAASGNQNGVEWRRPDIDMKVKSHADAATPSNWTDAHNYQQRKSIANRIRVRSFRTPTLRFKYKFSLKTIQCSFYIQYVQQTERCRRSRTIESPGELLGWRVVRRISRAGGGLVLPVRGVREVGPDEAEVPVLGGGEVLLLGGGADGEARGLAQLQVEALRRVAVARHLLVVRVPVFAVLSWSTNKNNIVISSKYVSLRYSS